MTPPRDPGFIPLLVSQGRGSHPPLVWIQPVVVMGVGVETLSSRGDQLGLRPPAVTCLWAGHVPRPPDQGLGCPAPAMHCYPQQARLPSSQPLRFAFSSAGSYPQLFLSLLTIKVPGRRLEVPREPSGALAGPSLSSPSPWVGPPWTEGPVWSLAQKEGPESVQAHLFYTKSPFFVSESLENPT